LRQAGGGDCSVWALRGVAAAVGQLFLAAGLLDLPLGLLTLAFFLGRLVSYSIYVSVATLADKQLGNVLGQIFGSPWAIALQIGLLVAVCLLPLVNWRRFLDRTTKP
jgi:hypothetical protein